MKVGPDLVVFITGGASGLGETTARYLISFGCNVGIADLNVDRMTKMKSELGDNLVFF